MRPVLLVGFAESLSAPEVVFGLAAAGFRLRLFTRTGRKSRLARTLKLDLVEITAPEQDIGAARRDLLRACDGVDGVFALDDVSLRLFADIADQTGTIRHIHATAGRAEVALDKKKQLAAARAAGLDVPEGPIISTPSHLPDNLKTPAIAKPMMAVEEIDGRLTKGDVHYLMTHQDVANFRALPALESPLIVQTLIHGSGEGIFGFATAEGVAHWSGHRRVRMMNPHGSGSSACMVLEPEADLRNRVETMMMTLGWRGPFMIELLRDEHGIAWFMELNGRVWGSMALARRNGLDYPTWAAEAAFDKGFTPKRGPRRRHMVRHLGREILHMIFLLRGPKTEFHRSHWPKWYKSLAGVLAPTWPRSFYNYDPAHPLFFLGDAWDTVTAVLRKRR
ncbi:hypothetical protein ACXYMO_06785 [Arenibacterium sp. CAU 1754]